MHSAAAGPHLRAEANSSRRPRRPLPGSAGPLKALDLASGPPLPLGPGNDSPGCTCTCAQRAPQGCIRGGTPRPPPNRIGLGSPPLPPRGPRRPLLGSRPPLPRSRGCPGPPRGSGPSRPCGPRPAPLASTRVRAPRTELCHSSRRSPPSRKLPYHCGCTAQAESPATPARENMVPPAPLKVGQTGLTAPARGLPDAPAHRALSRSLASSRRRRRSLASVGGGCASRGPTSFRLWAHPPSFLPLPVGGALGLGRVVAAGGRDGKVRFPYPEGHCQQDQVQGASEAALVLPDVPEAVPGRGKRARGGCAGRGVRAGRPAARLPGRPHLHRSRGGSRGARAPHPSASLPREGVTWEKVPQLSGTGSCSSSRVLERRRWRGQRQAWG